MPHRSTISRNNLKKNDPAKYAASRRRKTAEEKTSRMGIRKIQKGARIAKKTSTKIFEEERRTQKGIK